VRCGWSCLAVEAEALNFGTSRVLATEAMNDVKKDIYLKGHMIYGWESQAFQFRGIGVFYC
jgi:hypothetical protein